MTPLTLDDRAKAYLDQHGEVLLAVEGDVRAENHRIEGGSVSCGFCNRMFTFNFMRDRGPHRCDCHRAVEHRQPHPPAELLPKPCTVCGGRGFTPCGALMCEHDACPHCRLSPGAEPRTVDVLVKCETCGGRGRITSVSEVSGYPDGRIDPVCPRTGWGCKRGLVSVSLIVTGGPWEVVQSFKLTAGTCVEVVHGYPRRLAVWREVEEGHWKIEREFDAPDYLPDDLDDLVGSWLVELAAMSEIRTYLAGWDDAERCWAETLSWVPDEHLAYVVRERQRKLGIPDRGRQAVKG